LTPASASNTLSCQRETLHFIRNNSADQKSLDEDHGIYRAIRAFVPQISARECANYFTHAGYVSI
jgi:hypothetical protein